MAVDTLTERRGYVNKGSGFGGTIALIVGIGAVVAGAGVAGLQYAMSHGWDQPSTTGQAASEPPTTSINLDHLEGAGAQVETTSATLPVIIADPAAETPASADSTASAATPRTQPYIPPSHARHKSPESAPAPATGADPFDTTQ